MPYEKHNSLETVSRCRFSEFKTQVMGTLPRYPKNPRKKNKLNVGSNTETCDTPGNLYKTPRRLTTHHLRNAGLRMVSIICITSLINKHAK